MVFLLYLGSFPSSSNLPLFLDLPLPFSLTHYLTLLLPRFVLYEDLNAARVPKRKSPPRCLDYLEKSLYTVQNTLFKKSKK